MAGKKTTVKSIALVNLKYNKSVRKIGEELNVKIKDVQDLMDRGIIEPVEDIPDDKLNSSSTNEGDIDPNKDGSEGDGVDGDGKD